MENFERRYFISEVRSDEIENRTFRGYAAVFDSETEIGGMFKEKIAHGAFTKALCENDIRAVWNHNLDLPLGRTINGSLRLIEDNHGLAFELDLPDTATGRDAYELIRTGVVSGVSFGFNVRKDSWSRGENGELSIRTLEDIDLFEISPCTFPAYEQTNVVTRSVEKEFIEKQKEWQKSDNEEITNKIRTELDLLKLKLDIAEKSF